MVPGLLPLVSGRGTSQGVDGGSGSPDKVRGGPWFQACFHWFGFLPQVCTQESHSGTGVHNEGCGDAVYAPCDSVAE